MNISVGRMDDLCTACLCSGRNLYFIGETGFYHLFTDILNEIPVYDLSQVCVRVCWECRATLHRFHSFKETAKECYLELLQHLHQSTQPSNRPSHLQIEHINNISYPYIKTEDAPLDVEDRDESTEHMVHMELDIKDEHEHSEETFVNDLKVEQDVEIKPKKEKKKKKMKIKKQINIKAKKKPSPPKSIPNSYVKDLEYDLDCHDNDVEPLEIEETKESIELDMKKEEKNVIQKEDVTKEVTVTPKPKVPRSKEVLAEKPQCAECGKHFSSRKTYRYHLNVLHKGQNQYPCPRCGKVYQWKSNLGRHMRSHKARDAGELYCDMCDKRFASQATYRQHLKVSRRHVSESEFSFMCNDCGKKFVNKTRLRDHIDWEHLKKIKFRCQLCNKPFKCHTSLYVHMQNVHRNKEKKDNLCHVCGKSYQNAAKLKYHIVAMHTSETPYQCEQCSAAFGWYSSLYRHVREVHYKMKVQPKKSKRSKKQDAMFPHLALPALHPPPP